MGIVIITDPHNNVGCFTIVVGLTSSQLDVAYTEMKSVRDDMRKWLSLKALKIKAEKFVSYLTLDNSISLLNIFVIQLQPFIQVIFLYIYLFISYSKYTH